MSERWQERFGEIKGRIGCGNCQITSVGEGDDGRFCEVNTTGLDLMRKAVHVLGSDEQKALCRILQQMTERQRICPADKVMIR